MANLTQLIKRAAIDAVDAEKPTSFLHGTVVSASPLKVQVSDRLILTADVLIIPESLTNHDVIVEMEWDTEEESLHEHEIKGTKILKIKNALQTGDKVILARNVGGQQFFIIDREAET